MLDPELVRERLRGLAAFNEWELEEERESLPRLTVEESVRRFLDLCSLAQWLRMPFRYSMSRTSPIE